jgi:hypothetical protein
MLACRILVLDAFHGMMLARFRGLPAGGKHRSFSGRVDDVKC